MRAEEEEEHEGAEEETPQTRRAEFIEELLRDVGLPDRYTSLHVLLSFFALPQRATSDLRLAGSYPTISSFAVAPSAESRNSCRRICRIWTCGARMTLSVGLIQKACSGRPLPV